MDRVDHVFAALSRRMGTLSVPERPMPAREPIASLIDRVNAAKRLYEPGAVRR
ncbi:MAG TPA: hypothetical protein VJM09_05840 [Sphingobium sp.]|nr:hypothetical protein [Sphingobium sp.]